jgi:hypothetical protein
MVCKKIGLFNFFHHFPLFVFPLLGLAFRVFDVLGFRFRVSGLDLGFRVEEGFRV